MVAPRIETGWEEEINCPVVLKKGGFERGKDYNHHSKGLRLFADDKEIGYSEELKEYHAQF